MTKKFIRTILRAIFPFTLILAGNPAVAQVAQEVVVVDTEFFDANRLSITTQPSLTPHANHGAFEGGATGTTVDTQQHLLIPKDTQLGGGGFNIPTGAPPSPLTFGGITVEPFTQKMLRFEEFGPVPLPKPADIGNYNTDNARVFPRPYPGRPGPDINPGPLLASETGPYWPDLDDFLSKPIYPYPTRTSNTTLSNPWLDDIKAFLGEGAGFNSPAEGRPPGEQWAHQRYDEFSPQVYFQAAQAGARDNTGLRTGLQRHHYAAGTEFGPGGLYHNTVGNGDPLFDGTVKGLQIRFHPDMPKQHEHSLFTFDGTLPPKLLTVRYGESVLFRHYNTLPIDPAANNGFGLHTISTHEHNGHNPAESDGYTNAFFFPGQFSDYRWPIQLAGYDGSYDQTDPLGGYDASKAATPCSAGESLVVAGVEQFCQQVDMYGNGTISIPGDYRETMSTHWFHDHMLDFTASNVYKGNAAMMNYYSAIDRGNESVNDGVNLRLPSGSALSWGNRDYDVNLLIAAKAWDNTGQLFFNPFNTDGFLGDRMLVNWLFKPTMDVRARKYRFRMLNGSVSRYIKVAIVAKTPGAADNDLSAYQPVQFHMIANDGNIMEHSVKFTNGILPTQAIAERYDIIINFADYVGKEIYLVNVLEHKNGRGPLKDAVPLNSILSGAYNPQISADGSQWLGGDPVIGKFLRFDIKPCIAPLCTDNSMNPADYEQGGLKMLPLPTFTQAELDNATHRTFDFGRSAGTDGAPWTIKTDGGAGYNMDPRRLTAAPDQGDVEIWHMKTGGGWSHPIHVHFEEGKILSRDGMRPPEWETLARKDVYRIGPEVDSSREVVMAIRFREFAGTYMEHCHNTQHEDTAMLMRWDIETGDPTLLPTPMPTWSGVDYVPSFALATYKTGNQAAKANGVNIPVAPANAGDVNGDGIIDRIFDDATLRLNSPLSMEPGQVPDMSHILADYIKDQDKAIVLGKALFWDQAVGSDGQACASCHFAAGADNRSKNQLSAGFNGILDKAVNYQLTAADYPFPKAFDDVAGSQGTPLEDVLATDLSGFTSRQIAGVARTGRDLCTIENSNHYRNVTGRNSPSVINAVFNHRNFWDGRANNLFNGVDPFGPRTNQGANEGIWTYDTVTGTAEKGPVLIENSSLASQATGPANNTTEMACAGRTFPMLGRKMLGRKALSMQTVDRSDSVLGPYIPTRGRGLAKTYSQLIQDAFYPRYYSAPGTVENIGGDDYTQMEANFSLFWGLAIQMYEATLISDQTRFDTFARGAGAALPGTPQATAALTVANAALTENEKLGLELFVREDRAGCALCHGGSAFTNASVAARAPAGGGFQAFAGAPVEAAEPFERMRMGDGQPSLYDGGFYNIGVTLTDWDKCIGANDVNGNPLSYSGQAATGIITDPEAGLPAAPGNAVGANDFAVQGGPVVFGESTLGVDGACKTPSLRNVELTAPYFHNGSHSTLEQALVSYMTKFKGLYADENIANLAPPILTTDIGGLSFDGVTPRGGEFEALLEFIKTLTDERVRYNQAPFDHPSLVIPNGSTGLDRNRDGINDDIRKTIPAVGAGGYAAPLTNFLE